VDIVDKSIVSNIHPSKRKSVEKYFFCSHRSGLLRRAPQLDGLENELATVRFRKRKSELDA